MVNITFPVSVMVMITFLQSVMVMITFKSNGNGNEVCNGNEGIAMY